MPVFTACPMCGSARVGQVIPSLQKDVSLSGFRYVQCRDCKSFYEDTVTVADIESFYASLGPYESASSKAGIAADLARALGLSGTERLLDLGCGSGAWSLPLLDFCGEITCVDLGEAGLELLLQRVPTSDRGRVRVHNAHSLAFLQGLDDQSYDVLISMFSLEHDLAPASIVSEMRRVLRPGGRAVILVPSADALQIRVCGAGFYWFQAPWHTCLPSEKGLRHVATLAGFQDVRAFTPSRPFYSWFWIRALADRFGQRRRYDVLRRHAWFCRVDMAVDKACDRFSFVLRRPSYGFYILSRRV